MIAKLDNEIKMENVKQENARAIQQAESERLRKNIENSIIIDATMTNVEKIRLESEANTKKMELEAKVLKILYAIPDYSNVKKVEAIAANHNNMIYWGEKLPTNIMMHEKMFAPHN